MMQGKAAGLTGGALAVVFMTEFGRRSRGWTRQRGPSLTRSYDLPRFSLLVGDVSIQAWHMVVA